MSGFGFRSKPRRTLPIHLAISKVEESGLVYHLSPTAAAVLGRQLLGVSLCNPAPGRCYRSPAVDGQRSSSFTQHADDSRSRPVHGAIGCDAIDHQVVECIGLHEFRRQASRLIHVLGPSAELLEVPINVAVGLNQRVVGTTTSVQAPEVVLTDKVVNQVVPQGNPSIHGMLEYSEKTGVVRTLIKGGAAYHQMLAGEFATHLLGQVVDAKRIKPEKLDLTQFRAGVDFPQAIKDGFVAVQLKQITVMSPTGKLKVEATATAMAQHQSVTELMQEEMSAPLEGGWTVTAVQINLYYPGEAGRRSRVITAELTSMGRLRLPMRDPVMKANVERYLVEKGILARGQTLDADDFPQVDEQPQSMVEG